MEGGATPTTRRAGSSQTTGTPILAQPPRIRISIRPRRAGRGETMMDTEAFREFKTGLTFLRDNYATRALPHMRRAVDLDKNNPYYMSYLGGVLALSEREWGDAERLSDSSVRMKQHQERLYFHLAAVYDCQ